jgi:hypothetical protein
LIVAFSGFGAASADPHVVRFEPSAAVRLTDHDPGAPDVTLYIGSEYLGGGSGLYSWTPFVHGFDWQPLSPTGLLVEANIGPRLTSGSSGGYLFGLSYDELPAGSIISPATPGPWGVAHPEVLAGAPPGGFPLETFAETFRGFDKSSLCFLCHTVFTNTPDITTIPPGVRYIGFRWYNGSDVFYGWAAFRLDLVEYPSTCRVDDPNKCPDSVYDDARVFRFHYLAAAYQSEPGAPITAGGGLCRTDLDLDARVDFFDFATFLSLYAADDLGADFSGDGLLNFFDFSVFISEYGQGCDL